MTASCSSLPEGTRPIGDLIDRITRDGVITREEYQIMQADIKADGLISTEEKDALSRLWTLIKEGKVRIAT